MEGILFLVLSLVEEFSRVRTRERDWGRVSGKVGQSPIAVGGARGERDWRPCVW